MKFETVLALLIISFFSIIGLIALLFAYRVFFRSRKSRIEKEIEARKGEVEGVLRGEEGSSSALAKRLSEIKDEGVVELLIERIVEDRDVSHSQFRDVYDSLKITDRYITTLLKAKSWKKRAFAAEKLGVLGSAKAVPHLLTVVRDVKDEDEDVRNAALRALGRIRDKRALPFLIEALGYPETWLPPRVGEIIYRIGDEATESLIEELGNFESDSRRMWAAEILGWIGSPQASLALMESLSDLNPEVRAKSAGALGKIKEGRAVMKLLEMLVSDPVSYVRVRVAKALGEIRHPSVTDYLINILRDPEWWVKVRAIEALEQVGDVSIPGLLIALDDEDGEVRRKAASALERMGYVSEILDEYGQEEYKPELRKIILKIVKAGITETISDKLARAGPVLQKRIIRLLGDASAEKSVPALIGLLGSTDDWTIKSRVIESLGNMGAKEAAVHLLPFLGHNEYWIRAASVEALGKMGATEHTESIITLLADPNPHTREAALKALLSLNATGYEPVLSELLDDPSDKVRETALFVARNAGIDLAPDSVMALLLDVSDSVRVQTIGYIAYKKDPHNQDIIPLIHGGSEDVRREVLTYISQVKVSNFQEISAQLEVNRLSDAETGTLCEAAAIVGDEFGHEFLLSQIKSEFREIRECAYIQLGKFLLDEDAEIFRKGLLDPSPQVRIAALLGGARLKSNAAIFKKASKLKIYEDPDENVRVAYALASGAGRVPGAKARLSSMLQDRSNRVIAASLIGLASIDAPVLVDTLHDRGNVNDIRIELKNLAAEDRFAPLIDLIRVREEETKNIEIGLILAPDISAYVQNLLETVMESLDESARIKAVRALRLVSRGEDFTAMLGVMKNDPSPIVRANAMEVVRATGRKDDVISAITSMLADPSTDVKSLAARHLEDYDDSRALEALIQSLDTHDRIFREEVTSALSRHLSRNPSRLNDLIEEIPGEKARKLGLIWLLGKTRRKGCMEYLTNLLKDEDPDVRAASVGALAKFRKKTTVKKVKELLGDPNERVRAAVVNALGKVGGKSEIEDLEKMLYDVDGFVRKRASLALFLLDPDTGLSKVKEAAVKSPDMKTWYLALLFARGIKYDPTIREQPDCVKMVLEVCPDKEMRKLVRSSSDPSKRLHGLKVLGLARDDLLLELARKSIDDPSAEVKAEALRILVKFDE